MFDPFTVILGRHVEALRESLGVVCCFSGISCAVVFNRKMQIFRRKHILPTEELPKDSILKKTSSVVLALTTLSSNVSYRNFRHLRHEKY